MQLICNGVSSCIQIDSLSEKKKQKSSTFANKQLLFITTRRMQQSFFSGYMEFLTQRSLSISLLLKRIKIYFYNSSSLQQNFQEHKVTNAFFFFSGRKCFHCDKYTKTKQEESASTVTSTLKPNCTSANLIRTINLI